MSNLAIFISGSGTNAENIIKYFSASRSTNIALVVSDKVDAYGLVRAKNLNVPTVYFSKGDFTNTSKVMEVLNAHNVDFIVLAGFLCYVPNDIIKRYDGRIVNIHPSLLPKYGGKGMYGTHVHKAVVDNGEKESGITVHYVNEKFDDGEIIFQKSVRVEADDTYQTVEKHVRELEIRHYPQVIEKIINQLF